MDFTFDRFAARIDAILAPHDRDDAPGGVVGVAWRGRPIYRAARGMASIEHGVANLPTTPMPIGSATKQFTCAALLVLAARGALTLDDPLSTWLPEFRAGALTPTLRQLMTHTSGLPCYLEMAIFNDYRPLPAGGPMDIQLRQQVPDFTPGSAASYSNGGYLLLSVVIERASRMSLEAFLNAAVFAPAGMRASALHRQTMLARPGVATPYLSSGRDAPHGWLRALPLMDEFLGDGGVVSTADDMLRWAGYLRDPCSLPCLADLTPPTVLSNGAPSSYRLGLICETWRGAHTVQHIGALPGASSLFLVLPDHDLDIVLLFNRNIDVQSLGQQIVAAALGDALDPALPRPLSADHASLLGSYLEPRTGFMFGFADLDGVLGFSTFGNPAFALDGAAGDPSLLPFQAEVNLGYLRFGAPPTSGEPADAIAYCEGGTWHHARRIPNDRPAAADIVTADDVWFTNQATGAQLSLERSDGRLVVRVRGDHGGGPCPAEPVGPDLIRFWSRQFGGARLARLQRDDGLEISRIIVSGARTRGLVFARDGHSGRDTQALA